MAAIATTDSAGTDAGPGTEAAARVANVLMLFASGPQTLGVSAIARELGLSKAVVHRILRTLADKQLISVDGPTREYRLGPATAALGARALRDSGLRAAGVPVIADLRRRTGETTTLSALVPGGRVYLDQFESEQEIKMTVELGTRFPLHAGSSGKVILAFLPPERRDEVLADDLARLTTRTVVDADALRAQLDEIRTSGVAASDGERQADAGSVAAAVFDVDGVVIGSVSVCGPRSRLDDAARARAVPALQAAADTISRSLGWAGGLPEAR
ncbi:transcriptional regulator, IclR family [Jatrophihabitans endophyticus]|uniref:Transcriptional regulator, IclR family n=1 Tax=Jatrophihabitans endophyticus TaxID=1206085 RepID=A0A1M5M0U3_9ACTN|nr:IclR family transcriptional regulator [Jatrophihabitans endophyticus]SHG70790.1 transcriptional regulator, IclR family [Jatrophihabitans endophyticus]